MDERAIDLATFRSLEEAAGAEFVQELVATFLEEAPRMLNDLRAAMHARSADDFRRIAHSLKSNGLTFGATRLAASARELEHDAVRVVERGDMSPLDALAAEYARAAEAMERLRHA